MRGTNLIAPVIHETGHLDKLQVREVFLTIQGEGPFSGHRAVFIRLSGCNLKCRFCDTEWSDEHDPLWDVADIVETAQGRWHSTSPQLPGPLFVLTGGEPLRQPVDRLIEALLGVPKARVQVETAGTVYRDSLADPYVTVVVSPKTPRVHRDIISVAAAFKYVISAEDPKCPDTGVPIASTQLGSRLARLALPPEWLERTNVYLSPCDTGDPVRNLANLREATRLSLKHGYTLGVQLHKLAGVP